MSEPKSIDDVSQHGIGSDDVSEDHSIDPHLEKKLVRKLDMYIIPVYMIIYIFSFLDRSNIGNANVAGMSKAIHLKGTEFNVAVSIFYVTYIVFEIPLVVAFKLVGPRKMVSILMCSWSLVTAFSGFEKSYGALVTCRLLLGVCESALFPALHLYVSMFWKREELAKRAGMIMVSLALSGAFGGLFAYGVLQMDGVSGVAGWRWLFYIEGAISFALGIAAYWLLPDSPETAYFLTKEEKELGRARLMSRGNYEEFNWADVIEALTSPMCYLSGFIQLCTNTYIYGISTFLPTIINSIGYGSLQTQYLTIPVYVLGAISSFAIAYLSDRYQRRSPFMLFFGLFTLTGYSILLGSTTPGVLYFACFMVTFGGYVLLGLNIVWINGNTTPHYKRATAIAMNQTIGNMGGIIAGQIYLARESPRYITGQAVSLTACGIAWCGVWVMLYFLKRKNTEKERKIQEGAIDTGKGDESIYFKYQY
ncbi:high-affinity nicotinic acid transporter-like protein [Xylogone sp. PMI_703]|nr:high-affinity nicotinic acid transporter-like protein [Xylogone sp. PMI_703]